MRVERGNSQGNSSIESEQTGAFGILSYLVYHPLAGGRLLLRWEKRTSSSINSISGELSGSGSSAGPEKGSYQILGDASTIGSGRVISGNGAPVPLPGGASDNAMLSSTHTLENKAAPDYHAYSRPVLGRNISANAGVESKRQTLAEVVSQIRKYDPYPCILGIPVMPALFQTSKFYIFIALRSYWHARHDKLHARDPHLEKKRGAKV